MMPNTLHRSLGAFILIFLLLHMGNHMVGIFSLNGHIMIMEAIRPIYRNIIVETLLIGAIAIQLCLGLYLAVRSLMRGVDFFAVLQIVSGLFLVYFFVTHTSAALIAHNVLNLDTNFYFAASGLHYPETSNRFVWHYFFGVLAIFTHIACALRYHLIARGSTAKATPVALSIIAAGSGISALIVMALAGVFYEVAVPEQYFAFFRMRDQ